MARLPHFMTRKQEKQETIFGRMCNNDVVLDIIKYEPVKVGSKPI